MPITVITGEQRGDEGKGRFVDMLAEEHDIVARFNGGSNAGHTIVLPDERVLKLHLVPSGIAHGHIMNVIGNGTVLNPVKLLEEINDLKDLGIDVSPARLAISSAVHLIMPHHISEDERSELGEGRQGTTKNGIRDAYGDKARRKGVRAEIINNDLPTLFNTVYNNLVAENVEREVVGLDRIDEKTTSREYVESALLLGEYVTDTVLLLNKELRKDTPARVLAEGAQAFLLDNDQGMYPYTTSSSTTAGGVASGLGVPPQFIDRVVGVSKAVQSHVGDGPFVTEITNPELLADLHGDMSTVDAERGTTTGRTRRLGHLDLPGIRRSQMVNGTGEMALTKLDWVPRYGKQVLICVAYLRKGKTLEIAPDAGYKLEKSSPIYESLPTWEEDIQNVRKFSKLPLEARNYIWFIEDKLNVPLTLIGVGPNREQVIKRP